MPNFKLLREAYAIIGGIPARKLNLDDYIIRGGVKSDGAIKCNTIACAAGWLAMHPKIQEVGSFEVTESGFVRDLLPSRGRNNFHGAMQCAFDLTYIETDRLFASRGWGNLGLTFEERFKGNDRDLWLKRCRKFLADNKQLSADCIARGEQP